MVTVLILISARSFFVATETSLCAFHSVSNCVNNFMLMLIQYEWQREESGGHDRGKTWRYKSAGFWRIRKICFKLRSKKSIMGHLKSNYVEIKQVEVVMKVIKNDAKCKHLQVEALYMQHEYVEEKACRFQVHCSKKIL